MTDLSPAAQAVLDADISGLAYKRRIAIAAALRAAADQVGQIPADLGNTQWREGVLVAYRNLLAIAAELEGSQ